ncbi:MAG TPA: SDR family NAD(P)-dependent oxidoreductase, partial [Polyangium sp.]|nr:SDR family NAD(P)-dependent oxidoreductase [Polyangium sp.]
MTTDPIADWFYRIDWPIVPRTASTLLEQNPGRWLLLADTRGMSEQFTAVLAARGCTCTVVSASWSAIAEAMGSLDKWRGILYLGGLDVVTNSEMSSTEVGDTTEHALLPILHLARRLSATRDAPKCWIVTKGACAVDEQTSMAPSQAALWGIGRVFALEHPEAWGGLIDLDPRGRTDEVEHVVMELLSPDEEDQIAFRNGVRHVARLTRSAMSLSGKAISLSAESSYLVTGGLGGIGLHVAHWLVEQGARHLVLTGRRGMATPGAGDAIAALRSSGTTVTVAAVDVSDFEQMKALFLTIEPPLRGVIHAAGIGSQRSLVQTDASLLEATLRPKITGSWVLHRLTENQSLDFFVLFSSGAGVWGGAEQGAYAAANAYLDGLAHYRRALALPALSIAWGSWSDGGLADEATLSRLSNIGVLPMSTALALSAMERLLGLRAAQGTVTRMDWARFAPIYAARGRRNLLATLVGAIQEQPLPAIQKPPRRWRGLSTEEARPALLDLVRKTVARTLGLPDPQSLDAHRGFAEQGLDSLMAVEVRNEIQKQLDVALSATLAFDHPTVERLVTHLLTEVLDVQDRMATSEDRTVHQDEPIAIIGAACRFPGDVDDLEAYWQFLLQGGIAATEVPPSRWNAAEWYDPNPDAPGRTYVAKGGFLRDLEGFEPTFFRISPREAQTLDPQQRLMLEVSWEALERAGEDPSALRESLTGVFVGMGPNEYAERSNNADESGAQYGATGAALSFTAGRISFVLGLHGPSLAVDTACSSSLVALHLACQSLRQGECEQALAGGVNALVSPRSFVALSRMRALSPDGRCKTFSAEADGYGRAEGCGVLVLKRLSDARRDGNRILALIRGTAINHDGPSSGLTVPNGPAQQALIRQALMQANLSAADVDYVECHGTGTKLGDPIEVQALGATYGQGRAEERPLILGATKANLGHLESASGIAGLLKVVLALGHEQIPPQPGLGELSPHVPWAKLAVTVPRNVLSWPRNDRPRRAAVSAFGLSGTNAHVIVEEAPVPVAAAEVPVRSAELFILSAKTPTALAAYAQRLSEYLSQHSAFTQRELAFSLATTRSTMEHRLAIAAPSREVLIGTLEEVARGQTPVGAVGGMRGGRESAKIVFVFPGQGSQWFGMGRQLYKEEAAFRDALDACDEAIVREAGISLLEELNKPEATSRIHETIVAQPALFSIEVSLVALLKSWGVEPFAVIGHSVGEIAAAHVSGMLDLGQAARLVCIRSRVMQQATGHGKMVSVSLDEQGARKAILGQETRIGIAAVNDPNSVVLSGDIEALDLVVEKLSQQGVQTRALRVNYAFHSPQMEPLVGEFVEALRELQVKPAKIPMFSTVTGKAITEGELDVGYWRRNIRQTVRFAEAISASGEGVFVEVGPHPVLMMSIEQTLVAKNVACRVIPTLQRNKAERQHALLAVGALHTLGLPIDWNRLYPEGGRTIELPTYPWQHERYWIEMGPAPLAGGDMGQWPLAGIRIHTPGATVHHVLRVGPRYQPFLADHVVFGRVVVPGAFHLSIILAIAAERWPDRTLELERVEFLRAIVLNPPEEIELHVSLTPNSDGVAYFFELASFDKPEGNWIAYARGQVLPSNALPGALPSRDELERHIDHVVDMASVFAKLQDMNIAWGPLWQWLQKGRTGMDIATAELMATYPGAQAAAPLHPSMIDNGFAITMLPMLERFQDTTPQLPFAVERLRWWRAPTGIVRCGAIVRSSEKSTEVTVADLVLWDDTGAVIAEILGFSARRAPQEAFLHEDKSATKNLYRVEWREILPSVHTQGDPSTPMHCWVLGADGRLAAELGLDSISDMEALLDKLDRNKTAPRQLLIDATCTIDCEMPLPELVQRETAHALRTLQFLLAEPRLSQTSLIWLTRKAIATNPNETVEDLVRATLWGLIRSARSENPDRILRLMDIDGSKLPNALFADTTEPEIALRHDVTFAARLQRASAATDVLEPPANTAAWCIGYSGGGTFADLSLVPCPSIFRPLRQGEVRIAVRALGLNFLDVVRSLQMVQVGEQPLLAEAAGIVLEIGKGVDGIRPGDRVMGLMSTSGGPIAIADRRLIVRIPENMGILQAATIPANFLTAFYTLQDLGRLRSGERLLVHAAAGGTGMAAVQIAQHVGAEVFATASPAKWAVLRAMGLDSQHIANSRDLGFADAFLNCTGGKGVDVVLNSLAREFVDASLRLLPRGGRFLEMGKTDIRDADAVAMTHPGVEYIAFNLMVADPVRTQSMLEELAILFEQKVLTPLPLSAYDLRYAPVAFKHLANGRHVGKLILQPPRSLDSNGTALITGATGELGQSLAKHLVQKYGVKHLVLTSRRGADAPGAELLVTTLKDAGAETVTLAACDIANSGEVEALIQAISAEKPLRAVFHLAGVLDDGLVTALTEERLADVLRPKVAGAWNLHQKTLGLDLSAFELFSSASGVMGGAGQANYAAANTFLDALAAHRRKLGLAGQSLAWGFWEQQGLGMTAHLNAADIARMQRQGFIPMSVDVGLALLDIALTRPEATLVPMRLDLSRMQKALGENGTVPALLRGLVQAGLRRVGPAAIIAHALRQRLAGLSESERREVVLDLVRREIAAVIGLAGADAVPAERPLQELGLDSLMAVELRNRLAARAETTLPATLAFDYPTPQAIAGLLLRKAFANVATSASVAATLHSHVDEPIAIVGMACRSPGGVSDPESFWALLEAGRDAVGPFPHRWDTDALYDPDPGAIGKSVAREGGFLDDIAGFDAAFFGILPREAIAMDPQQRLVLETAWEALERAGIPSNALDESATGVYLGSIGSDYGQGANTLEALDGYRGTGTASSVLAGRLAYVLGLHGPAMTVDTACS